MLKIVHRWKHSSKVVVSTFTFTSFKMQIALSLSNASYSNDEKYQVREHLLSALP